MATDVGWRFLMARYVLLRIEDDVEADRLLLDMALYPNDPILTPVQENTVTAEVVPGKDPSDTTLWGRHGTKATSLETSIRASYHHGPDLLAQYEAEA